MRIPLDRRVWPGTAILLVSTAILWNFSRSGSAVALPFVLLLGHLLFFRDPFRRIPQTEGVLAPGDGKVMAIETVFEGMFLQEEAVKISIFLSIFDLHVNRSPIKGRVAFLKYAPGKFLNALRKESVYHNESNWIGLEEGGKRILVRQMAGAIARRIYWDVALGQSVEPGQKVGMICYGSRVECMVPKRLFQPAVQAGERVRAGQSLLGNWKGESK